MSVRTGARWNSRAVVEKSKHSEGDSLEVQKQTNGACKVNEMDDLSRGSPQDGAAMWLVYMLRDSFD